MRGDEKRVASAFGDYLEAQGWSVRYEVDYCDVVATRGSETIYAEAKGLTAAVGLDVDTMFGQLLRRMTPEPRPGDQYAAVLPSKAKDAVLRVPERVRQSLRIRVFLVSSDNEVTEL